ncbi:MAG: Phytochrome, two-component sensor histidine kinase [Myxococcaceae bacterium]|nr:Phytochrome, two-component sensor histidine kinase [Myxococcaceae bacterium]
MLSSTDADPALYAQGMTVPPAPRVVWVVDDSRLDAERARQVLARDHQVHTFHDGSAALEHLSAGNAPDVMVLDWVMPGVTGVEVCRFLRASGLAAQKIGILLLTVHRDTKQIVEGLSAGANDFLAKPYEDEELLARVSSLVRTRELHDGLELAQAENRRLLETAPDALIVSDPAGHLSFVNALAVQVFQRPREALLGRSVSELVPELRVREVELLEGESLVPLPDVTIGPRRFSPTLRTLGDGSTITSLRDVTERRLLEERRLDFYSIIAHDLRTPLHAMTLRLSTMIEGSKKHGRVPQVADLEKLDTRLHTLVEMINDFLDLASLEGASYRIERDEVDLVQLIDRVREEFSPLLEKNAQVFSCAELSTQSQALVVGDGRRLLQVLSNLISNAIKFTPERGSITASIQSNERYLEVSIQDNGLGIAVPQQAKLFQRYARAEHTVGGTGLGLMIVREIVEAHGGVVGVESAAGQGSRFWFRIPRVRGIALLA